MIANKIKFNFTQTSISPYPGIFFHCEKKAANVKHKQKREAKASKVTTVVLNTYFFFYYCFFYLVFYLGEMDMAMHYDDTVPKCEGCL